jgi:hypothetical protein
VHQNFEVDSFPSDIYIYIIYICYLYDEVSCSEAVSAMHPVAGFTLHCLYKPRSHDLRGVNEKVTFKYMLRNSVRLWTGFV